MRTWQRSDWHNITAGPAFALARPLLGGCLVAGDRVKLAARCADRTRGLYAQVAALLSIGDVHRARGILERAEVQATQIAVILTERCGAQLELFCAEK